MIKKIKRICKTCGKTFYKYLSQIKNGQGFYCSKKCYKNSIIKIEKIKCVCKTCKKEFYKYPTEIKRGDGIYCSKKCCKTGKTIRCIICNKEFYIRKYRIQAGYSKFCSRKCHGIWKSRNRQGINNFFYGKRHTNITKRKIARLAKKRLENPLNNPNWHGGKSFEPYGLEFNKQLKELIRQRDNYTCQECYQAQNQLKRKLFIHHIDYNKQNNNPENLISLCNSCHSQTNYSRNDWTNYFQNKV